MGILWACALDEIRNMEYEVPAFSSLMNEAEVAVKFLFKMNLKLVCEVVTFY